MFQYFHHVYKTELGGGGGLLVSDILIVTYIYLQTADILSLHVRTRVRLLILTTFLKSVLLEITHVHGS